MPRSARRGREAPGQKDGCGNSAERRRSWCSYEEGRRSLESRRRIQPVREAALRAERVTGVSSCLAVAALEVQIVRSGAVQTFFAVGRRPRVRPNPSLQPTVPGIGLGPRNAIAYHAPHGPNPTPPPAAELKR